MITDTRSSLPSRSARITGVGSYRPGRLVKNDEICRFIDSDSAWIEERSGIVTRRFADDEETVPVMGARAAGKALSAAGLTAADVSCVILSTMSYLHQAPPAAAVCVAELGAHGTAAFDLGAACAGFSHGLAVAGSLVAARQAEHVLVVGAERMSDIVDPRDRSTAFLFGDGAGAVVVSPSDEPGIGQVAWGTATGHLHAIEQSRSFAELRRDPTARWPFLEMAGPEVFRWAIRAVAEVCDDALRAAGVTVADIEAFVPHQANARIIDAAVKAMGLPPSVEVARTVREDGNTSAASIPLALDSLIASGRIRPGALLLTAGFGSGLGYSAQVVKAP
ncbi:beta-ketoacyl-ACP synthase III [Streptomyces sp. CB03911]|uniref:beta-ketoacyl-ACP synthase III n=1 Tax=Streptomycetaceae TaxID=2062 RepID=UPI00093E9CD8|nr:beta-ketoacyl-ACP synthase III [Streptomyces sp. CB03911]OKI26162.1 3-oxoacyl-ACP synthase [Streptomyces sp. CB03911]